MLKKYDTYQLFGLQNNCTKSRNLHSVLVPWYIATFSSEIKTYLTTKQRNVIPFS